MRKFPSLVLVMLALASVLMAQTKIPITIGAGDYGQLGYKRPDIGFNVGIEHFGKNYWFSLTGNLNPTDKIAYGDITQTSVTGKVLWKNASGFFLGGGGQLRNIAFHNAGQDFWTAGPIISSGWMIEGLRITLEGRPPRYDRRYNFYGVSWNVLYDTKSRFRIGFEQGIFNVSRKGGQKFGNRSISKAIFGFVF